MGAMTVCPLGSVGYGLENLFYIFVTGFLARVGRGIYRGDAEAQRNAEEEIFWGLFFVELKNTPYDAVSQQWNVEVDEETGFPGTEAEVGE